jgi:KipI family sensor histidine kinase inhibitor
MTPLRIVAAGDAALVAEFADRIDVEVNAQVVALAAHVRTLGLQGVRDIVATFRSVAVYFDPLATDVDSLARHLQHATSLPDRSASVHEPVIDVPVCYDEDFGLDLDAVARAAGLDAETVVSLHTGCEYRVFMLGFVPGFAHLGTVDARIAAPRLETPRLQVPSGSVAIAGQQTGVYPSSTPGGWNVIGRTPLSTWTPSAERPTLFRAGDRVRFRRIDRDEFDRLRAQRSSAA